MAPRTSIGPEPRINASSRLERHPRPRGARVLGLDGREGIGIGAVVAIMIHSISRARTPSSALPKSTTFTRGSPRAMRPQPYPAGEDALRLAESLDGVDLLLTDVVMPGMDGPELASRLRATWRDLPVLFVTGYSADRLQRSGAVGPRDRVLEKPYQHADLARMIRQMLETRTRSSAA